MIQKLSHDNVQMASSTLSKKVKGGDTKSLGDPARQEILLGMMLEYHMDGNDCITYEMLRIDLGIGHRVKSWLGTWKALRESGIFIEASTTSNKADNYLKGGYQLTQQGRDFAATDDYREYLKDSSFVPFSNANKHERIKKRLKWQRIGIQLFDLLLKHGPLTAAELAALIGVKRGSPHFCFAVCELKNKSIVESERSTDTSKALRLSDECFLKSADRPETVPVDAAELSRKVAANEACKGLFQSMTKATLPTQKRMLSCDVNQEDDHCNICEASNAECECDETRNYLNRVT